MRSLSPSFLAQLAVTSDELRTVSLLGRFRGRQDLWTLRVPEVLTGLRDLAIVESTESSNRIEGIVARSGRVRDIVLRDATPRDRSEQEIAGYREALQLIHEQAEEMPLSTNLVLQLHGLLYRYSTDEGGRWKGVDNTLVEHGPDGTVRERFVPVKALATPQAMTDLVDSYRQAQQQGVDPLLSVPLAVLDFLCIHPFRDGNGRVSRLLTLLLLSQHGYDVGRYVSLERITEQSKDAYYGALERSSQGWHEGRHDVHPWLRCFWGTLTAAYNELEERVGTATTGRGSKTERVRSAVSRKSQAFAISVIEHDCPDISREHIRKVLTQLRAEGLVDMEGAGRGAVWRWKG
ncbi:MAG: Fic family protein [Deltaproteobacteria bacterium]|nr:Fic family protein [Deltaproteobacteria bacterium]